MQAGRIIMEGERSIRRVLATTGTAEEGFKPSGRVAASVSAVAKEGERSVGCVAGADGVAKECPCAVAVFSAAVFKRSEPAPIPVQKLPSVRLTSEYIPIAVLYVPVARLSRAACPSAVLQPG